MNYDVMVIGGSYAGMAAALQLLRARRSVLIVDAGKRRNHAAAHSHGFLGQDGVDPAELARVARLQLMAYPTLTWVEGEVERVMQRSCWWMAGDSRSTVCSRLHATRRPPLSLSNSDARSPRHRLVPRYGLRTASRPALLVHSLVVMSQGCLIVCHSPWQTAHGPAPSCIAHWSGLTFRSRHSCFDSSLRVSNPSPRTVGLSVCTG